VGTIAVEASRTGDHIAMRAQDEIRLSHHYPRSALPLHAHRGVPIAATGEARIARHAPAYKLIRRATEQNVGKRHSV